MLLKHAARGSLLVLMACIVVLAGCAPRGPTPLQLLPYPQELDATGGQRSINSLHVELSGDRVFLNTARESVMAHVCSKTGASTELRIGSLEDATVRDWLSVDDRAFLAAEGRSPEAYLLRIPHTGPIIIVGMTDRGAMYGAQTLNQLLVNDGAVPTCVIRDWPDLKWRCLSPTMTWYSGYNRLEGYDLCNWTLDEWKWLVDWSLLHKCNAWAMCMYGYWPFTLPGHESNTLDVDSYFFNPQTGKKEPWRFTHGNIKKEFLPELIRYANSRGVAVHAYIGKNSFNGTYWLKRAEMNGGGAAELLPFAPGVHEYWDAMIARILEIGFNGFVFEDPEANHVPNQNEQCYKIFWEPWAATYGYTSVAQTNENSPPLGVHVEYYGWLFREFDRMIEKHAQRLGRKPEIYLISHFLLARIMAESKSDEERAKWVRLLDEKQGRKVQFVITESDESKYTKLLGGDRVASLGGRGGSCTCAMNRIASVNNNWVGGPMSAGVDWERDCQKRMMQAGGFGAMGYIFEWTNTEVFGYIAAQYLWRNAGVPFINNHDQFGFLDYAYGQYYGEQVGHLVARSMDEGSCVNDDMVIEGVYGAQFPSTGRPLNRDNQLLAAMADKAVELANRAYRQYSGHDPDLHQPVYNQDDFRWNGYDAAADKLFKTERLRLLCVSQERSRLMCEAALAHRRAERLMAESAPVGEVLKSLDQAIEFAKANQLLYQVNYDDDYDATDGVCVRITETLEALRTRLKAPELNLTSWIDPQAAAPLRIPWEKQTDITPDRQADAPGCYLSVDIGLDTKPDFYRLGVVFTIQSRKANGEWRTIFRRTVGRRSTGWEHWDIRLDDVRDLQLRFITDSYSRAQERNAPSWKWAVWGDPRIVRITSDGRRSTIHNFVEHIEEARRFVCMDSDGQSRPFNAGSKDSTGATFEKVSPAPINPLRTGEDRTRQFVSGFAHWNVAAPHTGGYRCYVGMADSSWVYGHEGGEVSWISQVLPRKQDTALVFIGGTDYSPGEAELSCDDHHLLDFKTGSSSDAHWENNGVELRYIHGGDTRDERTPYGLSGMFILNLPARLVSAGQPLKLAVRMKPGSNAWVMIHGYRDTFMATQLASLPQPAMDAIAAFTPHAAGQQGVTIAEYHVVSRPE